MKVPAVMVPDGPLPLGIETLGVAPEFFASARAGQVTCRRDRISSFTGGDEVELMSGDRIGADLVVFATGWRQSLKFLAPELQTAVVPDGHFRLYRHILPPGVPRLGFVGYASSLACQMTAEISAHWLSQSFRGELQLPESKAMEAEIDRVRDWLREAIPGRPDGYYVGPHVGHHIDELMADMGLRTRRKRSAVAEFLLPLFPRRYAGVGAERRRARSASRNTDHPAHAPVAREAGA
jgi:hypothetical protein